MNLLTGLVFEWHTLGGILTTWWAIVYVGIFSVAIGYTLQAVGQKHAPAADAALILSLEAVFAAFFGWLLLGERLGWVQLAGCGLILAAIVLAQVNPGRRTAGEPPRPYQPGQIKPAAFPLLARGCR